MSGRTLTLWYCLRARTHVAPLDSLYGVLTRFQALTPPCVRFVPVCPSAGRTVRLAGYGGFYGAAAIVLCGVLLILACV